MHAVHSGFANPAIVAVQQNRYLSLKPTGTNI